MKPTVRVILSALAAGGCLVVFTPRASAQGPGPSGSLGGYGAASSYANAGMGGNSAMVIPYGGMFEGFMPSRMGGGSTLSFRSRSTATMGSARTSFSLSPLSGGMTSGGMSQNRGARPGMSAPFGAPGGMGLGAGMGSRTPGARGMGVMPPSIGYPFRQPPSLVPSASPGAGMSM